jgi:hypothetical protein
MKRLALALALLATPALAQAPAPAVAPAPADATTPAAPPAPPSPPDSWLPRGGVELTGLDKITARLSPLMGRVGQPMNFGTLTVTVRSCIVRGPDQPADQAAFLDVSDSRIPNFAFHGWMLLSDPAVSVIEHPVYDLRLIGCRP